jgi:UDP-N-acetyl-D-galactosamine dehydrogenase
MAKITVIGLGYVGLPLAVAFAKAGHKVVGVDRNLTRINDLYRGYDNTGEVSEEELISVNIEYYSSLDHGFDAEFFIICVPTPVDRYNVPDLSALHDATEQVFYKIDCFPTKEPPIIIYESTVYPGATEDIANSYGFELGVDYHLGYSPERINPGDKVHTLKNTVKIISGSSPEVVQKIKLLYASIVDTLHIAPSIMVAEAAKVIENAQRDINIAFINEVSKICGLLNISTSDVLSAASTKWNWVDFKPGLVGGHCIGVDPYYLAYKAMGMGYHPEVILSGRRINDSMGKHIAKQCIKMMPVWGKVLILGIAFKENCPDVRNSKVVDIYNELYEYGCVVDVYDPLVDAKYVESEYGIELVPEIKDDYVFVIIAVAHDVFRDIDLSIYEDSQVFDVKNIFNRYKSL